jgi:toxin ParE1/3/4
MMHRVVYAPEAEAQLVALYFHIAAAASPEIAANYTDAIVNQCESLKTFPMRSARQDDIRPGLRVFGSRRRVSIAFWNCSTEACKPSMIASLFSVKIPAEPMKLEEDRSATSRLSKQICVPSRRPSRSPSARTSGLPA